jgi:hypothetical protein
LGDNILLLQQGDAPMKPGTRLKSAVCDTEVMVIKCGAGVIECGGAPMVESVPAEGGTPAPGFDGKTQVGKRYADTANTLELLCVKAGKGSLSVDGTLLDQKAAKPLPASD